MDAIKRVRHAGGRPKGRKNAKSIRKEKQIIELLDTIVDWKKFYARVYADALLGDSRSQKLLDDRRWGRPPQSVVVESDKGKPFPVALIPS